MSNADCPSDEVGPSSVHESEILEILCTDLCNLIVESRIPGINDRGYGNGDHCPPFIGRYTHVCDLSKPQCQKNQVIIHHLLKAVRKNFFEIDVLMLPDCCADAKLTEHIQNKDYLLLERWSLKLNMCEASTLLEISQLVRAVRSFLYFSQLSAWFSSTKGKSPSNIHYWIKQRPELCETVFENNPEMHLFPLCKISDTLCASVEVTYLSRTQYIPIISCSIHPPICDSLKNASQETNLYKQDLPKPEIINKCNSFCDSSLSSNCANASVSSNITNDVCNAFNSNNLINSNFEECFTPEINTISYVCNDLDNSTVIELNEDKSKHLTCVESVQIDTLNIHIDTLMETNISINLSNSSKLKPIKNTSVMVNEYNSFHNRKYEVVKKICKLLNSHSGSIYKNSFSKKRKNEDSLNSIFGYCEKKACVEIEMNDSGFNRSQFDFKISQNQKNSYIFPKIKHCNAKDIKSLSKKCLVNDIKGIKSIGVPEKHSISIERCLDFKEECRDKKNIYHTTTNFASAPTNVLFSEDDLSEYTFDNHLGSKILARFYKNENDSTISKFKSCSKNKNIMNKRLAKKYLELRHLCEEYNLLNKCSSKKLCLKKLWSFYKNITRDHYFLHCKKKNTKNPSDNLLKNIPIENAEAEYFTSYSLCTDLLHSSAPLPFISSKRENFVEENCCKNNLYSSPVVPKIEIRTSLSSLNVLPLMPKTMCPSISSNKNIEHIICKENITTCKVFPKPINPCIVPISKFSRKPESKFACKTDFHKSRRLLLNFEESVLGGCFPIINHVKDFSVEIGASGNFCPNHLTLPANAYFYEPENSQRLSAYMAQISMENYEYYLPKKGAVQVTLFNPSETVVRMFVVNYDFSDMPPLCHTFIRQKTYSLPVGSCDVQPLPQNWLRFIIHLRFSSSKCGKLFLHKDIKIVVLNKSSDDSASELNQEPRELYSFISIPTNPTFTNF